MEIKYEISKDLILENENNKIIAYNISNSTYLKFNRSASYILNLIKKKQSSDQIVKLLIKKFVVSENKAKKDLEFFLNELTCLKLIEKA